jgi:hypothetical protein
MSETTTIVAKENNKGQFVQVFPDGSEQPFEDTTDWAALRAMTDEEVITRALADPMRNP